MSVGGQQDEGGVCSLMGSVLSYEFYVRLNDRRVRNGVCLWGTGGLCASSTFKAWVNTRSAPAGRMGARCPVHCHCRNWYAGQSCLGLGG